MSKITEQRIAEVAQLYADWVPADAVWAVVILMNHDGSIRMVYGGRQRLTTAQLQERLAKGVACGLYAFAIVVGDDPEDIGEYTLYLIPTGLTRREEEELADLGKEALADWAAKLAPVPAN